MAKLTREDLIDVLRRTTDPNWLDPVLASPDSAAPLDAAADALSVVSGQGQVACDNTTISLSAAGRGGVSTISLFRPVNGTHGTIPAGYRFVDSRGFEAISVGPTTVNDPDNTISITVATVRETELANTVGDPGFAISATNVAAPDSLATSALIAGVIPAPTGYPTVTSATFVTITASTPITDASSDWLAAVGRERGQLRQANESDGAFRLRVRNVPDAVTPVAVEQGADGAASHVGLPPPILKEPFNDGAEQVVRDKYQVDWFDCLYMSGVVGPDGNAAGSPQVDFLEDIQPDLTNHKVRETVSLREARCYFREVFPGPLADPDALRMFWDDGFADDPVFGFADVHDHPNVIASLMSVWEEANRKRAAGVRFDEYIE